MKPFLLTIAWLTTWTAIGTTCTGCVTTTTTAKDGSVTTVKAPAPGVLPFAGEVLRAYSPRPIHRTK